MTTTINADTIVGGAIVTGDASGILELQAAGNRALSLNSSRAIGVGATPDYGSSGQVLTSQGAAAAPIWGPGIPNFTISSRTSNTILGVADKGKYIDLSGEFTQTFDAAATLGDGWYCYIRANGPNEVFGPELLSNLWNTNVIVNGTFTTDTDWTKGAGWTITGGAAVGTATTASLTAAVAPLTTGRIYRVTYTATVTSGTVRVVVGGINGTTRSASGTYTEYFISGSTAFLFQGVSAFTGTIDDVTCEAVVDSTISALEVGSDYLLTYTLANFSNARSMEVTIGSALGRSRQNLTYTKRFTAGAASTTITVAATGDGTTGQLFAGNPVTAMSLKKIVSNGTITLDPSGSETIDGQTTLLMYPREVRLIICNGTSFSSTVLTGYYKEYYASGTFTTPTGYSRHQGYVWGGGGSGSGPLSAGSFVIGGPGGGCHPFVLTQTQIASSVTVTVGAGGTPVSAADTAPGAGGASAFGSVSVQATSSNSGSTIVVLPAATAGTTSGIGFDRLTPSTTTGRYAIYAGGSTNSDTTNFGINSVYGGGAGGQTGYSTSSRNVGLLSLFAGNGGTGAATGSDAPGEAGFIPAGGGASAGTASGPSGAGARGEVRVWGVV